MWIKKSSSKVSTPEIYNKNEKMNHYTTDSISADFHSSKCIRVEDEDPEHIDSDYVEDECVVEHNKECCNGSNELGVM
ncbi:21199_t:CDS:2 [Gigaspora margarita]|uniref:21199_t:CDS:1 n=1 Tax=Gigaspora margarita TaxID=4874 RepID=A0ABN7UPA2_GIGMA|nr:21199_t:CDS:2 [Gigaspora margarita]